jgi:hypothetical protein
VLDLVVLTAAEVALTTPVVAPAEMVLEVVLMVVLVVQAVDQPTFAMDQLH